MKDFHTFVKWAQEQEWNQPPLHAYWHLDRAYIELLYTDPPYQVERVYLKPDIVVPLHRHPHIDSWEFFLEGGGIAQLGHAKVDGKTAKYKLFYIPHTMWHGVNTNSEGASFISIQHWLRPEITSVSEDWITKE